MPGGRGGDARRVWLWWRGFRRIGRALRPVPAVGRAVALGTLRADDFHAFNRRWYAAQPARYGHPDYVASGWFAWEAEAVERWFPRTGRVLVAAAGAGREMLALHRQGYAVEGFDPSAELRACSIEPFARAGLHAVVAPSEPDRCGPAVGPFDAVVVGWSAYGFIPTRARRVAFLSELAGVVQAGAPLLVSIWGRRPASRRYAVVLGAANGLRRLRRDVPLAPGDDLEPYFVHRFTRDELAAELRAAGFTVCDIDLVRGFAVARRGGPELEATGWQDATTRQRPER